AEQRNNSVLLHESIKSNDKLKVKVIILKTSISLKYLVSNGVNIKFTVKPTIPATAKKAPIKVEDKCKTSSI
uniref:hypothetical protein n=1 Tax=Salmonella enterica TaxID=28901 RepID=UPI0020C544B1